MNREVTRRLGGLRSAPMYISRLDFEEIPTSQCAGDWGAMAAILADAGRDLVGCDADCLLIGSNAMHRVAPQVQAAAPGSAHAAPAQRRRIETPRGRSASRSK